MKHEFTVTWIDKLEFKMKAKVFAKDRDEAIDRVRSGYYKDSEKVSDHLIDCYDFEAIKE